MFPATSQRPGARSDRLLVGVLAIGAALFAAHVALRLTWRVKTLVPQPLWELAEMDNELSICTWASVSLLLAVGVASAVHAARSGSRAWWGAAALFTYLSLDDHTMLHERIGWLWEGRFGTWAIYGWVLVLGPVFLVVGGLCLFGLWRSLAGDRALRRRLIVGFALMGVSLACEAMESHWKASLVTLRGYTIEQYTVPFEELAELASPALILSVVGTLLERGAGTAALAVRGPGPTAELASPRAETRRAA